MGQARRKVEGPSRMSLVQVCARAAPPSEAVSAHLTPPAVRSPEWSLHDALRALIRSHAPHVPTTACQSEHRFIRLLGRRAHQLQRLGLSRDKIVDCLLAEIAGSELRAEYPSQRRNLETDLPDRLQLSQSEKNFRAECWPKVRAWSESCCPKNL